MVSDSPRPTDERAPAPRGDERGAAIFIVVMVITLLTAIGVFAARASSLSETASGYDRQNSQNHYVAEYGMLAAVTELGGPSRNTYLSRLAMQAPGDTGDTCSANAGLTFDGGFRPPCYRFLTGDLQAQIATNQSGRAMLEPMANADAGTIVPGSLGPANLFGRVEVQVTDRGPVGVPVAGTDVGGTGPRFRYDQVTITATGQVGPQSGSASCSDVATKAAQNVSGNETGRGYVVVGPFPAQ